jgi:hypothetical protein
VKCVNENMRTARSLVNAAVEAHMQLHNIDRRAAYGWIKKQLASCWVHLFFESRSLFLRFNSALASST